MHAHIGSLAVHKVTTTHIIQQYNIVMHSYPSYNAEGFGAWDNSSCRVLNETDTEVTCGCDHLTHFAILLVSTTLQETLLMVLFFLHYSSCYKLYWYFLAQSITHCSTAGCLSIQLVCHVSPLVSPV